MLQKEDYTLEENNSHYLYVLIRLTNKVVMPTIEVVRIYGCVYTFKLLIVWTLMGKMK